MTDVSGRHTITTVPPGSDTLALRYEGEVREGRAVVIPDDGVVESAFVTR